MELALNPVRQVAGSAPAPLRGEQGAGACAEEPQNPELRVRRAFEENFDFLWRSARRLGLTNAEADDVAQTAFVILSRRIGDVELGRERAFAFSTMTRLAADVRKSAARRYEAGPVDAERPSDHPRPDQALETNQARAVLDQVVSAMPIEFRTVFVLFELEELTMAEIATVLEVAPGTVASRLRRARELFQAAVARAKEGRITNYANTAGGDP